MGKHHLFFSYACRTKEWRNPSASGRSFRNMNPRTLFSLAISFFPPLVTSLYLNPSQSNWPRFLLSRTPLRQVRNGRLSIPLIFFSLMHCCPRTPATPFRFCRGDLLRTIKLVLVVILIHRDFVLDGRLSFFSELL